MFSANNILEFMLYTLPLASFQWEHAKNEPYTYTVNELNGSWLDKGGFS